MRQMLYCIYEVPVRVGAINLPWL